MSTEPYNQALEARAEAEARVLQQKPKRFTRHDAECFEDMANKLLGRAKMVTSDPADKAPMFMDYSEKVRAGLGLPPPLERLQNIVAKLWGDVKEVEQFGTPEQQVVLRLCALDMATAVTTVSIHWQAEEIKRLEAER